MSIFRHTFPRPVVGRLRAGSIRLAGQCHGSLLCTYMRLSWASGGTVSPLSLPYLYCRSGGHRENDADFTSAFQPPPQSLACLPDTRKCMTCCRCYRAGIRTLLFSTQREILPCPWYDPSCGKLPIPRKRRSPALLLQKPIPQQE